MVPEKSEWSLPFQKSPPSRSIRNILIHQHPDTGALPIQRVRLQLCAFHSQKRDRQVAFFHPVFGLEQTDPAAGENLPRRVLRIERTIIAKQQAMPAEPVLMIRQSVQKDLSGAGILILKNAAQQTDAFIVFAADDPDRLAVNPRAAVDFLEPARTGRTEQRRFQQQAFQSGACIDGLPAPETRFIISSCRTHSSRFREGDWQ